MAHAFASGVPAFSADELRLAAGDVDHEAADDLAHAVAEVGVTAHRYHYRILDHVGRDGSGTHAVDGRLERQGGRAGTQTGGASKLAALPARSVTLQRDRHLFIDGQRDRVSHGLFPAAGGCTTRVTTASLGGGGGGSARANSAFRQARMPAPSAASIGMIARYILTLEGCCVGSGGGVSSSGSSGSGGRPAASRSALRAARSASRCALSAARSAAASSLRCSFVLVGLGHDE